MDVAVRVRRALEQLAVLVAVARGDRDQPRRLEDEMPLLALGDEAVRRAAGDHHVVAVAVGQVAERRLQRSRALVHEDALVVLAVAEEVVHRRAGRQSEISTSSFHISTRRPVISSPDAARCRREVPVRVRFRHPLLVLDRLELPELLDAARRLEVVEDRLVAGEALEAHDLLGQQAAVVAEDDVALAGDIPETDVEGHRSDLLCACCVARTVTERRAWRSSAEERLLQEEEVQRDDDCATIEAATVVERRLTSDRMRLPFSAEEDERDERERDAEREHDLADDERT